MFKAPFSFTGRIRRIEYLLSSFISAAAGAISFACGIGSIIGLELSSGSTSILATLLGFAIIIADIWFGLAQCVKRIHDTNYTGWLVLLCLVPIVNFVFGLFLLFADGTVGDNNYGPDPKNRMAGTNIQ